MLSKRTSLGALTLLAACAFLTTRGDAQGA